MGGKGKEPWTGWLAEEGDVHTQPPTPTQQQASGMLLILARSPPSYRPGLGVVAALTCGIKPSVCQVPMKKQRQGRVSLGSGEALQRRDWRGEGNRGGVALSPSSGGCSNQVGPAGLAHAAGDSSLTPGSNLVRLAFKVWGKSWRRRPLVLETVSLGPACRLACPDEGSSRAVAMNPMTN